MLFRKCRKCNIEKPINEFLKDNSLPSGYRCSCKECRNKKYIKKGPCKNNPGWFKKNHVMFDGVEKGWFQKGTHNSPLTEFKKGIFAYNKLDGVIAENNKRCNSKRRGRKGRKIRKLVLERDNFCCASCNSNDLKTLTVHHLKPMCLFPELMYELSNLTTLCCKCHLKKENHPHIYEIMQQENDSRSF